MKGKVKELFEKWYLSQGEAEKEMENFILKDFYIHSSSMQWGVMQDFYDSQGMQIYIKPIEIDRWSVYIDDFGHHILVDYLFKETRQEARAAALEKAEEILEEKL